MNKLSLIIIALLLVSMLTAEPVDNRNVIYSEDFSGQSLPDGWSNISNIGNDQVWMFDNPGNKPFTAPFDSDFAILDSDYYGQNNQQNASLITEPIDASSVNSLILAFDMHFRTFSESVALIEASNDGNNWTVVDSLTFSVGTHSGYPINFHPAYAEYNITPIAAGEPTLYIKWTFIGGFDQHWAIDNVQLYEPSSIPEPGVPISPEDEATDLYSLVNFNWFFSSGALGYKFYLGTDNPPSNIVNGIDLGYCFHYSHEEHLDFDTTYYWQIEPYNNEGSAAGNPVWSFTTMPDPFIYSFPYFQDFDGVDPPFGSHPLPIDWFTIENKEHNSTKIQVLANPNFAYSPPAAVQMLQWADTFAELVMISPPTTLDVSNTRVRFQARIMQEDADASIIVGIMTDPLDLDTFTPVETIIAETTYQEYLVELPETNADTVHVAIKHGGGYHQSIFVDDFRWEEIPQGAYLEITPESHVFEDVPVGQQSTPVSFNVNNTGLQEITIEAGGIELSGDDPEDFHFGGVQLPITLQPFETFDFYAQFTPLTEGNKEATIVITESGGAFFDIELSGYAYPAGFLAESFENNFPPIGWHWHNGQENSFWEQTDINPYHGNYCARSFSGPSSWFSADEWLITPKLAITENDSLIFQARRPDTWAANGEREKLFIRALNSPTDVENAVIVDSILTTTEWERYAIDLSEFIGEYYLAFHYFQPVTVTTFDWIYIDMVIGPEYLYTPFIQAMPDQYHEVIAADETHAYDLYLKNIGNATTDYSISVQYESTQTRLARNRNRDDWLFLNQTTGNLQPNHTNTIQLTVNTEDLSAGLYEAELIISFDDNTTIVPFELTVYEILPPFGINATLENMNDAILTWEVSDPQLIDSYNIYHNGDIIHEIVNPEITTYTIENLPEGIHEFYLTAIYINGEESGASESAFVEIAFTSTEDDIIPTVTRLIGNHPNPFNPETNIKYSLHQNQNVCLDIYSIKGQKVATLVDGFQEAGNHSIVWNGTSNRGLNMPSGIYFANLITEFGTFRQKLLLLK